MFFAQNNVYGLRMVIIKLFLIQINMHDYSFLLSNIKNHNKKLAKNIYIKKYKNKPRPFSPFHFQIKMDYSFFNGIKKKI
jgi:hypothetical protein